MPSTVNGIGTHYYGKKNDTNRKAVCNHCHNETTLTSYETRLWWVVLFLPVIPLKKKRIIDMCSACSYHFAHGVDEWETGKQQSIANATEQLRSEGTVGAGLEMHAALLAYREMEEADDLRESLVNQYPDNVKLLTGIANHLGEVGLAKDARRTWNQLHKLDPELPEPRYHLAIDKMNRDRLDEARELLRFLDEPGAEKSYNYDLLLTLAELYQKKGKHEDVLEITGLIGDRFPDYATNHRFRALVRKSEKVTSAAVSSLPPVQHSPSKLFSDQYSSGFRWFIGLSIATVMGMIGLAVNNYYISTHREITIINGTGVPAMVQVDDQDPVEVTYKSAITVSEGKHKVKVTGPLEEEYQVDVSSGYFSRWSRSPLWLVNIGGEAMVVWRKNFYAVNPPPSEGAVEFDSVLAYENIDYSFTDAPDSVDVEGSEVRTLTSLEFETCGNSQEAEVDHYETMLYHAPDKADEFVKRRLKRSPEKTELLTALLLNCETKQADQLEEFVKQEVDRQGDQINIGWHRVYQDIVAAGGRREEVTAQYKQRLEADPDNAALNYLYARMNTDSVESEAMFDRAIKLGDKSGFAHYAKAHHYTSVGEWEKAKAALARASETSVPQTLLEALKTTTLFGLKEYDELEKMYAVENRSGMDALKNALFLAAVKEMKSGKHETPSSELLIPLNDVLRRSGMKPSDDRWKTWHRVALASSGRLGERIEINQDTAELLKGIAITQRIEAGELEEAFSLAEEHFPDRHSFLMKLAIEYKSKGNRVRGEELFERAFEMIKKGNNSCDQRLLSSLNDRPVTKDTIENVTLLNLPPADKPLLFVAMATFAESDDVRQQAKKQARHFLVRKGASWPFYMRHLGDELPSGQH